MSIQITPEQGTKMQRIVQRWLDCGLSTAPADRAEAMRGIRETYLAAGIPAPQRIIWCDSPLQVDLILAYLQQRSWRRIWRQAQASLPTAVWNHFSDCILNNISETAADILWDDIGHNLSDHANLRVALPPDPAMQETLTEVLKQVDPLVTNIDRNIGGALNEVWVGELASVFDGAFWGDPLDEQVIEWGSYGGQHVVSRLAACECLIDVLGLPLNSVAVVRSTSRVARSVGDWWAFEKVCFVTERPAVLYIDAEHRLHCETGPAVRYRDGWERYYWHGVLVPAVAILSRDMLTVQQIEGERNIESRRVMIERYGIERFLADSGAEEISRDRYGVLYRKTFGDEEPLVMVKVTNHTPEPDGSFREFFIRVPPNIGTAHHAVAWTFGMKKEDYHPHFES